MIDKIEIAGLLSRAAAYMAPRVVVELSMESLTAAAKLIGDLARAVTLLDTSYESCIGVLDTVRAEKEEGLREAARDILKLQLDLGEQVARADTDLRIVAMELAVQSPAVRTDSHSVVGEAEKILSFLRKCETPAAPAAPGVETYKAGIRQEATNVDGLSVSDKEDGTWLTFMARGGKTASINVENLARNYTADGSNEKSIIYRALMQWCSDRIPF